jgi:ankyrin repeat protein
MEAKKKVTEILVESGADIKAKNKMGKDPAQTIVLNINIEPPRENWSILLLILQIIALIIIP